MALVHDWLTGMRGGERVLHQLALSYPQADLYTLIHVPNTTSAAIESLPIRASALNRLPGVARHYRKLLPLFPWAIRSFRLEGYDLVLSISHAVAKSVATAPGTPHLAYCLTPMRYVWDQVDSYLGRGPCRALAQPLIQRLRRFDVEHSSRRHVTRFVAISNAVAGRIRRHYGRSANVVHPPVEIERFRPSLEPSEGFYLLVAAFVPYKREDIVLDAFRRLDRRLLVVGDGPLRARLEASAPANACFLGRVSDTEIADLYARCRALIQPQDEDFGIAAVEAQAAGRPVISLGRGGALDTIRPLRLGDAAPAVGATGLFFEEQSVEGLCGAIRTFERNEHLFDPIRIRQHAERFAPERFLGEIEAEIEYCLASALSAEPSPLCPDSPRPESPARFSDRPSSP